MTLDEAVLQAAVAGNAAWRWFVVGYEAGVAAGHTLGQDESNQQWTDVTTAACRAGMAAWPPVRRATYSKPPLTADEIHRKAVASWASLDATPAEKERHVA